MKQYHFEGQVRRTDLYFRSEYPYLSTKIYQLSEHKFVIAIVGGWSDFDKLKEVFDHKIKPLGTPVALVCTEPEQYERELNAIPDSDIVYNFSGLLLTMPQLNALVPSLLPQFDYLGSAEDHSNQTIKYFFKSPLEDEDVEYIQAALVKLELPYKPLVCLKKDEVSDVHRQAKHAVPDRDMSFEVMSMSHYTRYSNLKLPYLKRDDEYWFDNVDKIYRGDLKKDDLFFWDKNKASCYLDLSVFENINIRNHILLYDVIYMTLPLGGIDPFLQKHKISRRELLWLIENERLVIFNVQPESRLDVMFLQEAHERRPESVVSRRSISALCAMDLVELNKNYIFNELIDRAINESEMRKVSSHKNIDVLLNFIFWPKSALRKSFDMLLLGGPMSITNYGANRIMEDICQDNDKLQFEYSIASQNAHIAHALGATYFPFITNTGYTDAPFSAVIGNTLNVYKACNFESFAPYSRLMASSLNSNISESVFETLDLNEFVDIEEFVSCSDIIKDKSIGMSLVGKLSALSHREREAEVLKYNTAILEFSKRKKNAISTIDTFIEIASVYPLIAIIMKALSIFKKHNQKLEKIYSRILDSAVPINESLADRDQVKYLYQINSIARLKKNLPKS